MEHAVRRRDEIPMEFTWDVGSVYPSSAAWEEAFRQVEAALPLLERFRGRLGEGPEVLLEWFGESDSVFRTLGQVAVYAGSCYEVDTANAEAKARDDRATALYARALAATSFAEPEILGIGVDLLRRWMQEEPQLSIYAHYFDELESRQAHVRSSEVEELLGLVQEPFSSGSEIHRVLTDTDLRFAPAHGSDGAEIEVVQGNIDALLESPDRELRRTAYDKYAAAHLALKNSLASCLATGVRQNVFMARARLYNSALEASLAPNHIPVEVFHNLIETFRRNLPIWHRYWALRRRALGVETLQVYDIKAPLTDHPPAIPYSRSVDWISEGMRPLGDEYVTLMRRGLIEQRWVDVYPNIGKRSGAFSAGSPGTHPFILMSYTDDISSLSTLAHELGHSMHSWYSWHTQPWIYTDYSMFVAEVASNFNQAMVRAYLHEQNPEPAFQIALIEEAMANFHRYFFIMPTLARFELEIHQRVERGEALSADTLIELMASLFAEGYGGEVAVDEEQVGITWAQFPIHLYLNFYVFQYATGIAAAAALSSGVLREGQPAADRYLQFLQAGSSMYPLDALKLAGVDMSSPQPVETAFQALGEMVDRLAGLLGQ